jgi:hypothetical protein
LLRRSRRLVSGPSGSHVASSDAAAGAYLAHAYPGTYDVHVAAPHHLSEDFAGVMLAAGASVTRDVALYPNCTLLSDDVENGNQGWTAQSPWVIQSNVGGNATHVWNTPNYGDNLDSSLTSASHDLGGYADLAPISTTVARPKAAGTTAMSSSARMAARAGRRCTPAAARRAGSRITSTCRQRRTARPRSSCAFA